MGISAETPKTEKSFIKYVAYLQIIGIVLVVFGHSFHEYPNGKHGFDLLIYRMMLSFRMPLFMFVSGLLMMYTTILRDSRPSWSKFAKGKFKRLMIPFIVLTLVTFIPRTMMSGFADDDISLSFNSLLRAIFNYDDLIIPFFWFLQSSFTLLLVVYLILTIANKLKIKDYQIFIVLILIFGSLYIFSEYAPTYFSLYKTCEMGIFFILGTVYCRWSKSIDKFIPWESPIFFVVSAMIWACFFFLFEHTKLMFFCSVAGIAMCISFAKILVKKGWKLLDHLVGANYIIFLLSWYFNIAAQQVLHHLVELPWWVYTVLSLVAGIYVPWLFYRYLLRHPDSRWATFSRLFLGQNIKSRKS